MGSLYRSLSFSNLCISCLQAQRRRLLLASCAEESASATPTPPPRRSFSSASQLRQDGASASSASKSDNNVQSNTTNASETAEEGAMSRRLAEMTEQAMLEGGRSARKSIQEAGFSEELKRQLEERVKETSFKSEHASAISVANMPSSAGKGTQDIAAASPWTGTESLHDTTLRMLDDAKKPMRVPYKIPQPTTPVNVNLKPTSKAPKSAGHRLADARDRTSAYVLSQSSGLTDEEREALRKEFSQRFEPGARSLPMTISGLASLANERIEDAMARGQFKNIPRGKGKNVERDHNASSAFIDTTEYFMNKIIQKQEIVPPWIEKQQELAKEVDRFRQRLRTEWRRHAARLIASQGGSLQEQIRRAQAYAAAEARVSETKRAQSALSSDADGTAEPSVTPITHEGRLSSRPVESSNPDPKPQQSPAAAESNSSNADTSLPNLPPLRDPAYLSIERSYHELQVKTINNLIRSYNLQAPRLAQKPYLNLERELNACYADVAPTLADEIARRATERASSRSRTSDDEKTSGGSGGGGILDMLAPKERVRVYEEDSSKGYGLREFWRDLWGKKDEGRAS
ncbi:hypothetical protein VTN77DRAFT_4283 [Rasamsonia byssochlamydoides]|uniref:uncharacterized protein n=1 Tax=Rasamsonia byssochlamydoides TaxID=89139 RepID=UPI003742E905